MLEKLVSKILAHYLSDYIEAIDPKMFEISAMKGQVSLNNLNVKSTALDSIHPAITIQKGTVVSLNATVPWRHIKSRPSMVQITGLYLLASFKTTKSVTSSFTEEKERKQLIEKWNVIDAWEEEQSDYLKGKKSAREPDDEELLKSLNDARNSTKRGENGDDINDDEEEEEEENIAKDGFGLKFVKNLVRNLTVVIKNTHARIELAKPMPLAIGLAFESLELESVNPRPNKKEMKKMEFIPIVKKLTIRNFCVYINPAFQSYYDNDPVKMGKQFFDGIPTENSIPPHCYLLRPITITAVVNMNPRGLTKQGLPKFGFDLNIPILPVRLISSQLSAFLSQPVNWMTFGMSPIPLYHKRPDRPPSYTRRHRQKELVDGTQAPTGNSDPKLDPSKSSGSTGLYASKWWRHLIIASREQLWLKRPIPFCTTNCDIYPELNEKPATLLLTIYALLHIREKHGWGWIVDKRNECKCDPTGCYGNSTSKSVSDGKNKIIFDYAALTKEDKGCLGCRYCGGRTRLLAMEGRGGMNTDMLRMGRQAAHDYLMKRGYNPGNFAPGSKEFIKQQKKYKVPEPKLPPKTDIKGISDESFIGGWVGMSQDEFKRLVYCVETIQKRQQLLSDIKEARDKNKDGISSFVKANISFGGINAELCLSEEDIINSSDQNMKSPFLSLRHEEVHAEKYEDNRPLNGPEITKIIPFSRFWIVTCNGSLEMQTDNSLKVNMSIHDLGARNYCCDNKDMTIENNKNYPVFLRKMPNDPSKILTFLTSQYEFKNVGEYVGREGELLDMGNKPLINFKMIMPGKNSIIKETSYNSDINSESVLMSKETTNEYITSISSMSIFMDMQPLQIIFSEKAIVSFLSGMEIITNIGKKTSATKNKGKEQLIKADKREFSDVSDVQSMAEISNDIGGIGKEQFSDMTGQDKKFSCEPWFFYESINKIDLRDKAVKNFKSLPRINIKCSAPIIILPISSSVHKDRSDQMLYLNCGDLEVHVDPPRLEKEVEFRKLDGTTIRKNVILDPENPNQTSDVTDFVFIGIKAMLKGTSIYIPQNEEELMKCIKLKKADGKTSILDCSIEESSNIEISNESAEITDVNVGNNGFKTSTFNESTLFHPFCIQVGGYANTIGNKIGYKKASMKINMRGWDSINGIENTDLPVMLELNSNRAFNLLTDLKFMFDRILTKSSFSSANNSSQNTQSDTLKIGANDPSFQSGSSNVYYTSNDEIKSEDETIELSDDFQSPIKKPQVPKFALTQEVLDLDISCNNITIVLNIKDDDKNNNYDKCEINIGEMKANIMMKLLETQVKANFGETNIRYIEDNYLVDLFKLKTMKDDINQENKISLIADISVLNMLHPNYTKDGMKVNFGIGSLEADLNLGVIMKFINTLMGFSSIASSTTLSLGDITNNVTSVVTSNEVQNPEDSKEKERILCPKYVYTGKYTKETVSELISALINKKGHTIDPNKCQMTIEGSVEQIKAFLKDNYSHLKTSVDNNENSHEMKLKTIPYHNYVVAFINQTIVKVKSTPEDDIMNVLVTVSDIGVKERSLDTNILKDVIWTERHEADESDKPFVNVNVLSIPKTSPAYHDIPLYVFVSAINKKLYAQFRPSLYVILLGSGLLGNGNSDNSNSNKDKNSNQDSSSLKVDLVKLQRKIDLKLPSVYREDVPSLYDMCQNKIDEVKEKSQVSMMLSLDLGEIQMGMRVSDGEALDFLKNRSEKLSAYDFFISSIRNVKVVSSYPILFDENEKMKKYIIGDLGEDNVSDKDIQEIKEISQVYKSNRLSVEKLTLSRYDVSIGSIDMKYMIGVLNEDEEERLGNDPNYNLLYDNSVGLAVLNPITVSVNAMMPLLYNDSIKEIARGNLNRMYLDMELCHYGTDSVSSVYTNSAYNSGNLELGKKPIGLILTPITIKAMLNMLSVPQNKQNTNEITGTIGFLMSYKPENKNTIDMTLKKQKIELPDLVSEIETNEKGEKIINKNKNMHYVIKQYCTMAGTNHDDLPDNMCKGSSMSITLITPGIELSILKSTMDTDSWSLKEQLTRKEVLETMIRNCQMTAKLASFVIKNIYVGMVTEYSGFDIRKDIINPLEDVGDRKSIMELSLLVGSITAETRSTVSKLRKVIEGKIKSKRQLTKLRDNTKFGLGLSGVGKNCVIKSSPNDNSIQTKGDKENYEIIGVEKFYGELNKMNYKKFKENDSLRSRFYLDIRDKLMPESFIGVIFRTDNYNYSDVSVNLGVFNVTARPNLLYEVIDFVFGIKFPSFSRDSSNRTQSESNSIEDKNKENSEGTADSVGDTISKALQSKKQTGLLFQLSLQSISLDLISRTMSKTSSDLVNYNIFSVKCSDANVAARCFVLLDQNSGVLVPIIDNLGVSMYTPIISYWRLEQLPNMNNNSSSNNDLMNEYQGEQIVLLDKKWFKKSDVRYFLWKEEFSSKKLQNNVRISSDEEISLILKNTSDINPSENIPNNLLACISLPSNISLNLSVGDAEFVSQVANEILELWNYISHKIDIGKADEVVDMQEGEMRELIIADQSSSLANLTSAESTVDKEDATGDVNINITNDSAISNNNQELKKVLPRDSSSKIAYLCKKSGLPHLATKISIEISKGCIFAVVIEDSASQYSPILSVSLKLAELKCGAFLASIPNYYNYTELNIDLSLVLNVNQFNPRVLVYEPLLSIPKITLLTQVVMNSGIIPGVSIDKNKPITKISANIDFPGNGLNICIVPESVYLIQTMTQVVLDSIGKFTDIGNNKKDQDIIDNDININSAKCNSIDDSSSVTGSFISTSRSSSRASSSVIVSGFDKCNKYLRKLSGLSIIDTGDEHVNTQLPRMEIRNYLGPKIKITFIDVQDRHFMDVMKNIDDKKIWKIVPSIDDSSCKAKIINLPPIVTEKVSSAHAFLSFQLLSREVLLFVPLNHEYSVTKYIEFPSKSQKKKSSNSDCNSTIINVELFIDHNQKLRRLTISSGLCIHNDSEDTIRCHIINRNLYYMTLLKENHSVNKSDLLKELDVNSQNLKKYISNRNKKASVVDITSFIDSHKDSFAIITNRIRDRKSLSLCSLFTLSPKSESYIPAEYMTNVCSDYILFFSKIDSKGNETCISSTGLSSLLHDDIIYNIKKDNKNSVKKKEGKSQEDRNIELKSIRELFKQDSFHDKRKNKYDKEHNRDIEEGDDEEDNFNIDVNLDNMRAVKIVMVNKEENSTILLSKSMPVVKIMGQNIIESSANICGFLKFEGTERNYYKFCYERTYKNITKLHILNAVKFVNNHCVPLAISLINESGEISNKSIDFIKPHGFRLSSHFAPTNQKRQTTIGIRVADESCENNLINITPTLINIACLTGLYAKPEKTNAKELKKKEKKENDKNKLAKTKQNKGFIFNTILKLDSSKYKSPNLWDGNTNVVISAYGSLSPLVVSFGPSIVIHNNLFNYGDFILSIAKTKDNDNRDSYKLEYNSCMEIGGIDANNKNKVFAISIPGSNTEFAPLSSGTKSGDDLAPIKLNNNIVLLRKSRKYANNTFGTNAGTDVRSVIEPGCCLHIEVQPSRVVVNKTRNILGIATFKDLSVFVNKIGCNERYCSSMKALNDIIISNSEKISSFVVVQPNERVAFDSGKDNIIFIAKAVDDTDCKMNKLSSDILKKYKFSGPIYLAIKDEYDVAKKDTQLMLIDKDPLNLDKLSPINILTSLRTYDTVDVLTITQVNKDTLNDSEKNKNNNKQLNQHETRHISKYVIRNNLVFGNNFRHLSSKKQKDKHNSLVILQCLNTDDLEADRKPEIESSEIKTPIFITDPKRINSTFIRYDLRPDQMVGLFKCCNVELKDCKSNAIVFIGVTKNNEEGELDIKSCSHWYQINMDKRTDLVTNINGNKSIRITCSNKGGRQCLTFSFSSSLKKSNSNNVLLPSDDITTKEKVNLSTLPSPPIQLSATVTMKKLTVTVFDSYPMPTISIHLRDIMMQLGIDSVVNKKDGNVESVCNTTQQLVSVSAALNLIQIQLDHKNIRNKKGKIIPDTYCKFPVILTRDCRVSRNTPMVMCKVIIRTESGPNACALTYIPLIDVQMSPLVISCDDKIIRAAMKLLYDYKILGVERADEEVSTDTAPINSLLTNALSIEQGDNQQNEELKFVCIEKMKIGCVSARIFLSLPRILSSLSAIEVNNGGKVQTISLIPPSIMRLIHVLMPSTGMGGKSIIKSKIEDEGIKVSCYKTGLKGASCSVDTIGNVIGMMYLNQIRNIVSDIIGSNFNAINIDFASIVGKTKWEWLTIEKFFSPSNLRSIRVTFNNFIENFTRTYTDSSPYTKQLYDKESRSEASIKIDLKSLNPLSTLKQLNVFKTFETKLEPDRLSCLPSYPVDRKDRYIPCRK